MIIRLRLAGAEEWEALHLEHRFCHVLQPELFGEELTAFVEDWAERINYKDADKHFLRPGPGAVEVMVDGVVLRFSIRVDYLPNYTATVEVRSPWDFSLEDSHESV